MTTQQERAKAIIHFCGYGDGRSIQIYCDDSWTEPRWKTKENPDSTYKKEIYHTEDNRLYTFNKWKITCIECYQKYSKFLEEQDLKYKTNIKKNSTANPVLQDTFNKYNNAIFLDCINNFSNCLIPRIMTLHKDDFLEFIIKNMDNIVLQGDGKDPKWIGSSEGGYFWRIYKDGMIETNIKYMTSELLHELAKNIEKLESFLDIEENI